MQERPGKYKSSFVMISVNVAIICRCLNEALACEGSNFLRSSWVDALLERRFGNLFDDLVTAKYFYQHRLTET